MLAVSLRLKSLEPFKLFCFRSAADLASHIILKLLYYYNNISFATESVCSAVLTQSLVNRTFVAWCKEISSTDISCVESNNTNEQSPRQRPRRPTTARTRLPSDEHSPRRRMIRMNNHLVGVIRIHNNTNEQSPRQRPRRCVCERVSVCV